MIESKTGENPLRALVVHSGNMFGGVETALLSLARASREHLTGLDLSFALCYDTERLADELRAAGHHIASLGVTRLSRPWQVCGARARLRRLLESSKVDLCIIPSSWTHTIFAPTVVADKLPLVIWAHDRWTSSRWLDRVAMRHRPCLIVANSAYTADGMKGVFPGVPIRVIHCAVDRPPVSRISREAVRAACQSPDDAVVVVQVGRLDQGKGHRLLLEALGLVKTSVSWRCWIVGGADTQLQRDYLSSLQRAATLAGISERVTFTGARQDVPAILAAADIFCQPNTLPESFGIVFIEALQAGLPVVGAASGGVLGIVTEECGRLIPPGDAPALARILTDLIESRQLRLRLAATGPARAARLCDPEERAIEFAQAMVSVIEARSSPKRSRTRAARVTRNG